MAKAYLALYKGKADIKRPRDIIKRIADAAVRRATKSRYSHCEIAVQDNQRAGVFSCYSSSARDGGVRKKVMALPPERWDLIELPPEAAEKAARFYRITEGCRYDFFGVLAFVLPFVKHGPGSWFCSEWCARALDYPQPCRHSPESLYATVSTRLFEKKGGL